MGRKSINKKRKSNPEKQQEWIEILIPYFQKHGLKDITMDEVARVLNKSKATIYKYFKSREEIIEYGLAHKLRDIQQFEQILKNGDIAYLERYFESIAHLSLNISDISNRFLSDLKHQHPALWERVVAFIDYAMEILKEYYQQGIDDGIFIDVDPALMVMSDRFFFQSLSDPDFLISHNLTINQAFQQYFKMKFSGIVKDPRLLTRYKDSLFS